VRDLAGVRAELWTALKVPTPERRGPFNIRVVARLKDGATLESAARDLAVISERIFPQWASSFQDRTARMTPYSLRETMLGNAGQTLGLFAAAVALVLLIAVANVASLTLVRVAGRSREAVLRTVLGASSARVARMLVTESLVLSALGATAGALLAPVLLRGLVAVGPPVPRLSEANIDARAVAFAAALALIAGVIVGVYPALALFGVTSPSAFAAATRDRPVGRSTQCSAARS
jgi:putative ABC transport system permease protein